MERSSKINRKRLRNSIENRRTISLTHAQCACQISQIEKCLQIVCFDLRILFSFKMPSKNTHWFRIHQINVQQIAVITWKIKEIQ